MTKTDSNYLKLSKTLRISMLFTYFQPFSAGSTGSTGSMNYAPDTESEDEVQVAAGRYLDG